MFMVDLAVPRDIEPEVGQLDDVYLYTVDDLSALVQTAGEKRQAAVSQAEAIIDAGVQNFVHWLEQRAAVPLIQALQTQADTWRQAELIRARKLLAKGSSVEEALDALARGLTQKMLHGALAELHNADLTQRAQMSEAVSRLFLRGDLRVDRGTSRGQGSTGARPVAASPIADQVGSPVDASSIAAAPDAERRRA
jgi:glutamyl-tRNA reductase